jgi:hypothetical protein
LTYGLRPAEVAKFKAEIKRIVATFEEDPERSDSPVSDYLDREQISSSRQVNRDNVKKLGALLTELSGNRLAIRQQLSTEKPQVVSVGCIQLLIQTLYVDVGPDLLKMCYELEYKLELLRRGNPSNSILSSALEGIESVYQRISDVRQRIMKGDFAEPAIVSMMMWSPTETASISYRFGEYYAPVGPRSMPNRTNFPCSYCSQSLDENGDAIHEMLRLEKYQTGSFAVGVAQENG